MEVEHDNKAVQEMQTCLGHQEAGRREEVSSLPGSVGLKEGGGCMTTMMARAEQSWMLHAQNCERMLDEALSAYDRMAKENAELHCQVKQLIIAREAAVWDVESLRRQKAAGYYWRFFWAAMAACVMTIVAGASWVAWWLR